MKKRSHITKALQATSYKLQAILLSILFLAQSVPAKAADPTSLCINAIDGRLAQEQRIYRATLFGRKQARDEQQGTARYDAEGNAWLKTKTNTWVTDVQGFQNTTWSDAQMDNRTEWEGMIDPTMDPSWKIRRGIFETRGVATSELIPSLTQTFRSFTYRTLAICDLTRQSLQGQPPKDGMLTVGIPGGTPLQMKPITACIREGEYLRTGTEEQSAMDSLAKVHCEPIATEMLNREQELLKLLTTYDAAYRSLLQFAGQFDEFQNRFQGDLIAPIRQSMSLLSQLSRIPCFLSQCNE